MRRSSSISRTSLVAGGLTAMVIVVLVVTLGASLGTAPKNPDELVRFSNATQPLADIDVWTDVQTEQLLINSSYWQPLTAVTSVCLQGGSFTIQLAISPINTATEAPTPAPTGAPTPPTVAPTPAPTTSPAPTKAPTPPTVAPTAAPTTAPTAAPTNAPTAPTVAPTPAPTKAPTPPTNAPTAAPTRAPTAPLPPSAIQCNPFDIEIQALVQTNGTGSFVALAGLPTPVEVSGGQVVLTFTLAALTGDVIKFQWTSSCPTVELSTTPFDFNVVGVSRPAQTNVSAVLVIKA